MVNNSGTIDYNKLSKGNVPKKRDKEEVYTRIFQLEVEN
jgi:hypothetical protein